MFKSIMLVSEECKKKKQIYRYNVKTNVILYIYTNNVINVNYFVKYFFVNVNKLCNVM